MRYAQSAHYRSLRVGDADRDQVVESLNDAWADGRLDADELDGRRDRAMRALTYGELERVTADLPGGAGLVRYWPGGIAHRPRSKPAVASAALGLGGWLGPTFFAWIPAVVLGHRARREIRRDGTAGFDLTTIGLTSAYAGLALLVVCVCALVVLLALMD